MTNLRHHPGQEVACWVIKNTHNPYSPYGFQAISSRLREVIDEGHFGLEAYEVASKREQERYKKERERHRLIEEKQRKAAIERQRKKKEMSDAYNRRAELNKKSQTELLHQFKGKTVTDRLHFIIRHSDTPLAAIPKKWALLTEEEIIALPAKLRKELYERISSKNKGIWRKLAVSIKAIERSIEK